MNKKLLLLPLIALLALTFASAISAQEANAFEASISVLPGEYSVGDPILLEITVNHTADSQVIIPTLGPEWGSFIVYSQSPPETTANADGSETTTVLLDVRQFAPGEYSTPAIPISIATIDGQVSETLAEPAAVNIASVLIEGDTELRDIKPQADLPYLALLPWIIGAVFLTEAALLFAWAIRRRHATSEMAAIDNRLPHEIALDLLNRVERLDLPRDGRFKEHYTLISDCVRTYVEDVFDIPVMERTTSEIQRSILRTSMAPALSRQFLSLLDESDLVKFSKFTPDTVSAKQALLTGRHIILETMPSEGSESGSHTAGEQVHSIGDVVEPSISVNGNRRHTEVQA
ncbi:MAG: hypothetical protein ACK2T3_14385 [Candidatus Promineifilaceae bacterium]